MEESAMKVQVPIDREKIAAFCRRHHIRKLGVFGSVLRDGFRPDSDVDVLVEFVPGEEPGFLELSRIEDELADLLGGHRPDLVSAKYLNRRLRERVLADVEVQYAEG